MFLFGTFFLLSCGDEKKGEVRIETTPEAVENALTAQNDLFHAEEVAYFYESRGYEPAWIESDVQNQLFEALRKADEEGLAPEDYQLRKITILDSPSEGNSEQRAAKMDILLTDAFLAYAEDLFYGKLDPNELYEHYGVPRPEKDFVKLLTESLKNENISEALENLKPNHKVYKDLKVSLAEFEKLKEQNIPVTQISEGELIKPGAKDPRIPVVAKRLQELQLLPENYSSADSLYSEEMQTALENFQKDKGLETDAVLGNSTIHELNMTPEQRYNQILANLERWRWYPRDLGDHYILVNIAAFNLVVVKAGDTVRRHNVVAGAPARPTPIFSDTLQYIVLNPTWTVPPTIKANDIIPKASANPAYLGNNNMRVYDPAGNPLDPSEINWSGNEAKSYTYVQGAGPANPLGRVKIIYPNKYLIYLHDTPAQALFGENERAESSGCVRVENALDLAAYTVEEQEDWDGEKIRETIESGETTQVKINRPIRVHHFYWTAWRADGEPVFVNDVYELDEEIYSRLKA